jgi:hypothetical protein
MEYSFADLDKSVAGLWISAARGSERIWPLAMLIRRLVFLVTSVQLWQSVPALIVIPAVRQKM